MEKIHLYNKILYEKLFFNLFFNYEWILKLTLKYLIKNSI